MDKEKKLIEALPEKAQIIGVCGRSGSGKTTVVKLMRESGCKIVDADKCARKAVEKGSECLAEISERFGGKVLADNGELDRKALAALIFGSDENRKALNDITLKHILKIMRRRKDGFVKRGASVVVYDAPLLFESGLDKECDHIVAVISDDESCIKRIVDRDGISKEDAARRLASQIGNDRLILLSDHIIHNNDGIEALKRSVNELLKRIFAK